MSGKLDGLGTVLASYGLEDLPEEVWTRKRFEQGEFLCLEGYPLPQLLFLLSGTAKACVTAANGKTILYSFYQGSGVLGDVELMLPDPGFPATSSVQAVTAVRCVGLPMDMARRLARERARFAYALGEALAQKLDHASRQHAQSLSYPLQARLCAYIAQVRQDGVFSERLTELAEMLGVSYRHLLRILEGLCAQGVLRKERGRYRIVDPAALEALAAEKPRGL